MMRICDFRLLVLCFSGMFSVAVHANVAITPMKIYAQSPLQSNSLTTELRSAFSDEEGNTELFASGTIASVWAHSENFSMDYYQNQAIIGTQWQVTSKIKTEIKYQYSYAGNNGLDPFVYGFHDLFGIGQNGRDEVEDDQFTISVPKHGVEISDFKDEILSNALHGYVEYQAFVNENHAVSVGASLYFNKVGSGPFKRDSFEQGLQTNYSFNYEKHAFFSTLGITFQNRDGLLSEVPYKNHTLALAFGYGYALTPSHHFVSSYHIFEGAIDDADDYSEESHEFVLGYRYLMDATAFEFSVIENAVNMDNSTDIAFTFGLRYQL